VPWRFFGGTGDEVNPEGVQVVAPWNRMYVYDVRTQDRKDLHILTNSGLSVALEASIRTRPLTPEIFDEVLKALEGNHVTLEALLRWKGIEATGNRSTSQNAKVVVIGSGKDRPPLILGGGGS
jgi:hypothetical protein